MGKRKKNELEKRIEKAKREIDKMPDWFKFNMRLDMLSHEQVRDLQL